MKWSRWAIAVTVMTIATPAMAHAARASKTAEELVYKKTHKGLFGPGAVPVVFSRPFKTPTGKLLRKEGELVFLPWGAQEGVRVDALFEKGVVGEPLPGLYYLFSFNRGRQLQRLEKTASGGYRIIRPKKREHERVWPSSKERLPSLLPYGQYLEVPLYKDMVAADLGDEHVVLANKQPMLKMAVADGATARKQIFEHFKTHFPQNEINKLVTRPAIKTGPQPIITYLHDLYFNFKDGNVSWETYRTTHEWQTGEILEAARVENELSATHPRLIEVFFSLKSPDKALDKDAGRNTTSAALSNDH